MSSTGRVDATPIFEDVVPGGVKSAWSAATPTVQAVVAFESVDAALAAFDSPTANAIGDVT